VLERKLRLLDGWNEERRAAARYLNEALVCEGVTLENEVFIGHGVMFVNDKYPRATTSAGALQGTSDWQLLRTVVESRASIGSGAVILGGVRVGADSVVGAGAVVTRTFHPGLSWPGTRLGRCLRVDRQEQPASRTRPFGGMGA